MTFKTKFKIGERVIYTNEDIRNSEATTTNFELIPLGKYRICAVHLSCFPSSKTVRYHLDIPGFQLEEILEERLLAFNVKK